ncbi:hypothetical protein KEM54_001040 [Ascosphaera aggregata]|nr:hypothetical protein KEM54_001040 [Ascosphaera aggregata]
MLHGNQRFDKILSTFKHVLSEPLKWLFCDLGPNPDYTEIGTVTIRFVSPTISNRQHVLVPPLDPTASVYSPPTPPAASSSLSSSSARHLNKTYEDKHARKELSQEFLRQTTDDLTEWLALVALDSPSVRSDDSTDPFISRYALPAPKENCQEDNLVHVNWNGLIPARWIMQVVISLLCVLDTAPPTPVRTSSECVHSSATPPESWFALTCSAFMTQTMDNDKGYTILALPRDEILGDAEKQEVLPRQFILWEYAGGVACF